jgi:tetratricopeptide (TPR) repeat protein
LDHEPGVIDLSKFD